MKRDIAKYIVEPPERLPLRFVVRDLLFTVAAWAFWFLICWDVIVHLGGGVLHAFDGDLANEFDWQLFVTQLKLSYTFSGSVIIFLFAWGVTNTMLVARTIQRHGMQVPPLSLADQATSYNCTSSQVRGWREQKIITVTIDNKGNIENVR